MFAKITYHKDAVSYVEAEGKLDIYNAPDYLEQVKESLKRMYARELILDFSKISYVASIGLRVILELYNIMQNRKGVLKLKNVNNEILHAFKITGFDKFLIIENGSDAGENSNDAEQTDV